MEAHHSLWLELSQLAPPQPSGILVGIRGQWNHHAVSRFIKPLSNRRFNGVLIDHYIEQHAGSVLSKAEKDASVCTSSCSVAISFKI